MRLFVAVDVTPDVEALIAGLPRPPLASVRWTNREQWHVTLRFLGEAEVSRVEGSGGLVASLDTVPAVLAEAAPGPLLATLGPAVAWFPGRRVLQIPVGGLDALAAVVTRATESWSAPEQPFRGHLTLARMRGQARGPVSLAGTPVLANWPVEEFVLYSSVPGPGGSRYAAVHRVALQR